MNPSELTFLKRMIYRLFGLVRIDVREIGPPGLKTQFYLVNCSIHGPFETYKQGWRRELRCPGCREAS